MSRIAQFGFRSITLPTGLVLAMVLWPLAIGGCNAQESTVAEKTADSSIADATSEEADLFPIPEGLKTASDYFDFVEGMNTDNMQEGLATRERQALENKLARTVLEVVDRVVQLEPNAEDTNVADNFRLQAAFILNENGAPGVDKILKEAISIARSSKDSSLQTFGLQIHLNSTLRKWRELSDAEKKSFVEESSATFKESSWNPSRIRLFASFVGMLQRFQEEDLVKLLLTEVVPSLESNEDRQIQLFAQELAGLLRRMNLPGSTLKMWGPLLSGGKLDWKEYEGKVVLVNFWSNSCVYCRKEMPDNIRLYNQYRDRGFEVIGVSLDAEKKQAESFVDQYKIPWPVVFDAAQSETDPAKSLAMYYAVTSMPQNFLVDKEGKVVSLYARGPELEQLLENMLGEPRDSLTTPR